MQVSTRNGSAIAGGDYRGLSTTLSSRNGEPLTRSVPVALIGDTVVEPKESFSVRLSSARNAVVADGSGAATVLDDDARPNHPPTCVIDTPAGAITLQVGRERSLQFHRDRRRWRQAGQFTQQGIHRGDEFPSMVMAHILPFMGERYRYGLLVYVGDFRQRRAQVRPGTKKVAGNSRPINKKPAESAG